MSRPLVYFYTANRKRKERHNRARYTRTRPMELRYLVTHTAQWWKTHESGRRVFSPRTGAPVRTAAPSLSVWGGRPADRHEPQLPLELFSLSLPRSLSRRTASPCFPLAKKPKRKRESRSLTCHMPHTDRVATCGGGASGSRGQPTFHGGKEKSCRSEELVEWEVVAMVGQSVREIGHAPLARSPAPHPTSVCLSSPLNTSHLFYVFKFCKFNETAPLDYLYSEMCFLK